MTMVIGIIEEQNFALIFIQLGNFKVSSYISTTESLYVGHTFRFTLNIFYVLDVFEVYVICLYVSSSQRRDDASTTSELKNFPGRISRAPRKSQRL